MGGLEDLQAELQRQARARAQTAVPGADAAPGFGFVLGLIEHAHDQRRIFRGLIGRRSGYVVHQRFREMVVRLVHDELPPPAPGGLPRAAAARWLSAAFVELLSWWVEQTTPMPTAELEALFIALAQPVLQRSGQQPGPITPA